MQNLFAEIGLANIKGEVETKEGEERYAGLGIPPGIPASSQQGSALEGFHRGFYNELTIALRSVAPPPASRTRSERHSESRARSRGAASPESIRGALIKQRAIAMQYTMR
ncbi:unnamed protein product [Pleuronectes platessa]|uniref:Uncharacterized protein n=1 Tax=Pleuronectes platessa TaxID=8262 RepID=A0A9N7U3Y5_PLEPL|nr:unnamed protein product [Pleuronectes platessa]